MGKTLGSLLRAAFGQCTANSEIPGAIHPPGSDQQPPDSSNHQIQNIDDSEVSFFYKDYKDNSKKKLTKLSGVEFLRRFCLLILPYRFVKIRYYGILSSKQKQQANPLKTKNQSESKRKETNQESIVRLIGFDRYRCPFCNIETMHALELLSKIRSQPMCFTKQAA